MDSEGGHCMMSNADYQTAKTEEHEARRINDTVQLVQVTIELIITTFVTVKIICIWKRRETFLAVVPILMMLANLGLFSVYIIQLATTHQQDINTLNYIYFFSVQLYFCANWLFVI